MNRKYFLLLIFLFTSCNSNIIITKQDQIKVLEITILEAQKDNFLFNDNTKYEIKIYNWYEYLDRCKKLPFYKICKKDMNDNWNIFYKYKLKDKKRLFWFIKIYNKKKNDLDFFYIFFIDPKTHEILLKYHDMNYKYQ